MTFSGTVVRCTYDYHPAAEAAGLPPPDVDDYLATDAGTVYLITQARVVRRRSRAHTGTRLAYVLLRLDPEHVQRAMDDAHDNDRRVGGLRWYGRRHR